MNVSQAAEEAAPRVPLRTRRRRWSDRRGDPRLLVGLGMIIGVILRIQVARQSLFGDELATYWIITTRGFGGLISALYATHDEITPPLFFVGAWLSAHISHAPVAVRATSLVAGTLTIPAVYLLGLRTVGQRAALLGSALCALSPFMIYYSAEARAYGLMMLLVTLSTLALLKAIDTGSSRWWVAYAICVAGAFYTHYTSAFYLVAQAGWALWANPQARRQVVLASLGAAVLVAPWAPAVINAARSPTTAIMSELSPFTAHAVVQALEHWTIGYPYTAAAGLTQLPGDLALAALGGAIVLVVAGFVARARVGRSLALGDAEPRVVLIFVLFLAVPVGEALVSSVSTHLFGVRNLASAWPPFVLAAAFVATAVRPRLAPLVAVLAIAGFAIGAGKMLDARFQRPDYEDSAAFVDRIARPGDVIIDDTRGALTPGPLTALDVFLRARLPIFRADVPQENQHPFTIFDPVVSLATAIREAVAAAHGGRIIIVIAIPSGADYARVSSTREPLPPAYRLTQIRVEPGIVGTAVQVYADRAG